jgi:arylsulfatase A
VPAGPVSNYTFAFWDVMPTLADILGIPQSQLPSDIDGISVKSAWFGNTGPEHGPLYWEFCTNQIFGCGPGYPNNQVGWARAVRWRQWKAVSCYADEPFMLFDLANDLGETTDISGGHPDIVATLTAFAKAAHVDSSLFPVQNCVPSVTLFVT